MTRVVTSWSAYGVYRDEALTRQPAFQFLRLTGTAANTDTAFDLGDFAGTFWGQVDNTATGLNALKTIKDISTRALEFQYVTGLGLNGKALIDASRTLIRSYDSTATAGSTGASRALTVTGLLSTDTVLGVTSKTAGSHVNTKRVVINATVAGGGASTAAVATGLVAATDTILGYSQTTKNANGLPLLGVTSVVDGGFTAEYSADPGGSGVIKVAIQRDDTVNDAVPIAFGTLINDGLTVQFTQDPLTGAVVTVEVSRAAGSTTPDAGTYQLAMNGTNTKLPDLTFASGDAPTAFQLILAWVIKEGEQPVFDSGAA